MELSKKFDELKDSLPRAIVDKISFAEYDLDPNGNPKPIDIREVIALLTIFNKDQFTDSVQPVIAYSSKKACLDRVKQNPASYEKLYGIAGDILILHDHLYSKFAKLYSEASRTAGKTRGDFGRLTGVSKQTVDLRYTNKKADHNVPAGFLYPMLNAFRAFLEEKNDKYTWGKKINPVDMVDSDLCVQLAGIIGEEALKNANPNRTGKSALLWQSCYQKAELFYLKKK